MARMITHTCSSWSSPAANASRVTANRGSSRVSPPRSMPLVRTRDSLVRRASHAAALVDPSAAATSLRSAPAITRQRSSVNRATTAPSSTSASACSSGVIAHAGASATRSSAASAAPAIRCTGLVRSSTGVDWLRIPANL